MKALFFCHQGQSTTVGQLQDVGRVKGPDVPHSGSQGADRKRQHSTPLFSTSARQSHDLSGRRRASLLMTISLHYRRRATADTGLFTHQKPIDLLCHAGKEPASKNIFANNHIPTE
jgi:hypothetical protein